MSGICGLVHLDGAPVPTEALERLTTFQEFRGPDGRHTWSRGPAGFGHTLLRTTIGAEPARQPLSLEGNVWITADARIDARAELLAKLEAAGRVAPAHTDDASLILHAYHAWGERCLGHLIGDFAFAIWDGRSGTVFCARDHFGVKPFFYALANRLLVFSNTLNCVRAHPGVGSTVDEQAIGDFLLFESIQDPTATIYRDVHRLAPAHCLSAGPDGTEVRRYWSLPYEESIRYRAEGDYVEHFRTILESAVSDRIRTDRISVTMSGGLDSTSVAAVALAAVNGTVAPRLRAHTAVYDQLIPDEERFYSGLAGERLKIPIGYRALDGYALYERFGDLGRYLPEPFHDPLAVVGLDLARDASSHGRVVLTGWDGDALLSESPRAYFRHLLRERRYARLAAGAARYALAERKLVPAGAWRRLAPWTKREPVATEPFPRWIAPDFARRLHLPERFRDLSNCAAKPHPFRPHAFRMFEYLQQRSSFFDRWDPGCTGLPVEYRNPLLDVRLVQLALSLPPYPWCARKEILRRSMRGVLPERVRTRPKAGVAGYPHQQMLRRPESAWVDRFVPTPLMSAFVDRAKIPASCTEPDPYNAWVSLRPLSLDLWLRNREQQTTGPEKIKSMSA